MKQEDMGGRYRTKRVGVKST